MAGRRSRRAAGLIALLCLLLVPAAAFAHPPYGIVADGAGRVYFTDLEQVWRIGADGKLALFRPGVDGVHVHELALAPNGDVIGVQNAYDSGRDEYSSGNWRRTADGRETWPVPMTRFPPNGSGPTLDRAGNFYVTQWVSNDDHRVMLFRRSPAGRVDLLFGDPAAAARFREEMAADVGGLALAPDGSIVFADGALIRRVSPGGEARILYDGGSGATLRGLALAPDGTVLVADLAGHRLVSIAPDGKAAILYRGTPGWGPTGVALAGGRLLVLEAEEDPSFHSHLVRVVEIVSGKARLVAAPGGSPAHASGAPAPSAGPNLGFRRGQIVLVLLVAGVGVAALLGGALWAGAREGRENA
jgi:hypothetical protein